MAITQDVVQYDNDFLVEVRIEDTEDLSGSRVVLPAEEAFEFGCVLARAAQHAWRLEQEWRASLS